MPANNNSLDELFRMVTATGESALTSRERLAIVKEIRNLHPEAGHSLDTYFVGLFNDISQHKKALAEAQTIQKELELIIDKLGAVPWHSAVFIRFIDETRAQVAVGGASRIVGLADGVDRDTLHTGTEVYLGNELNVIVRGTEIYPPHGEVATFVRMMDNGQIVLSRRGDEEIVVTPSSLILDEELEPGDTIRWDSRVYIAFEKVQNQKNKKYLIEDVKDIGRENVGGQNANMDTLLSALTAALVSPDKAALYGLVGRQSVLMIGPPGCGKTLMARVTASEMSRISGEQSKFFVVKPAEFESPWVGSTEANIRECFTMLRKAAEEAPCVLFLDEIESIGRIRGGLVSQHSDRFLAAFLAELDGFADRSRVAVIAATNRKDLVDPALLERLSDIEIRVSRPDMGGARAIFTIHLPESYPYKEGNSTREDMIETAVSYLYSPNANNLLCSAKFRDGRSREIHASDVISGRVIAQICYAAKLSAYLRDVRTKQSGLCVPDIVGAVNDALNKLSTTLTPGNIRVYLEDIPQDNDVVSVERPDGRKRIWQPHLYLNAV